MKEGLLLLKLIQKQNAMKSKKWAKAQELILTLIWFHYVQVREREESSV